VGGATAAQMAVNSIRAFFEHRFYDFPPRSHPAGAAVRQRADPRGGRAESAVAGHGHHLRAGALAQGRTLVRPRGRQPPLPAERRPAGTAHPRPFVRAATDGPGDCSRKRRPKTTRAATNSPGPWALPAK
jgi:hypothetical protein